MSIAGKRDAVADALVKSETAPVVAIGIVCVALLALGAWVGLARLGCIDRCIGAGHVPDVCREACH